MGGSFHGRENDMNELANDIARIAVEYDYYNIADDMEDGADALLFAYHSTVRAFENGEARYVLEWLRELLCELPDIEGRKWDEVYMAFCSVESNFWDDIHGEGTKLPPLRTMSDEEVHKVLFGF